MPTYQAFGLIIDADLIIPEWLSCQSAAPEVFIRAQALSSCKGGPSKLLLNFNGIGRFFIENGTQIGYELEPGVDYASARLFLLGSAMGALLQQRGLIVLHGNALSWDQKMAHIVVGHSGAGKSTYAAHAYQQGAWILTDDLCAITFDAAGQALVLPGYPQLKLWQESATLLGIATPQLRAVKPGYQKYALPLYDQFFNQPLPIASITELNPMSASQIPITGLQKLNLFLTHTYRYPFLREMQCELAYHQKLLRLAEKVPTLQQPRQAL